MSKRKQSPVDLTVSSPLSHPVPSRPLTPCANSAPSSRLSHFNRSPKRHRKADVNTFKTDAGCSAQTIDVDSIDDEIHVEPSIPIAGPSNLYHNPPMSSHHNPHMPSLRPSHLLAAHTCPICFAGVTNACLTPCGHLLCGACLFAAVKSGIQRALVMGMPAGSEGTAAKCPVCRALLKGWDGRGGGIIPLKIRTIVAL